ncbi:THO complex subunit 7 homolog [Argiope bruennichi]|uniref:THO complex subunit 7 like protein n=1 Tax=Argiope bruennichi TaxID=94029 RepID=A0A8T0FJ96_ARGBR|nr:THO complex subunit 7 homolog [Argiope bruennichi]KAF8790288.1 THO complex subunit 7 like protein [Argiope bruennichi]
MSDSDSDSEAGASHISDEEIFRRKILMDGEGTGASQGIDNLLCSFIQWCDSEGQTDEEISEGYQNLLAQLDNLEFSCQKSDAARRANMRQLQEYDQMCADLESKIVDMEKTVAEKRLELEKAKKERLNKMKYDALGKIVSSLPSRQESMEKLAKIEEEIKILMAENEALQEKSDVREKQVRLLVTSARELKHKLREELEDWEGSDSD